MKIFSLIKFNLFFVFVISSCSASNNHVSIKKKVLQSHQDIFDLTNLLPKGYKVDGSVDYTRFLQDGINKYETVKMPNFPILINKNGLTIPSNRKIIFDLNSSIIIEPNNQERYEIIRIHNVENVIILNANLIGDRFFHENNIGEWGMGISIKGSKKIKIYGSKISNCWGDGIVIGSLNSIHSEDILIDLSEISNSRRNGISIGSAKNVIIKNSRITKSNGTLPMAGICIEPNGVLDVCNNIKILNIITKKNGNAGIQIGLSKLLGGENSEVNILIDGHKDIESKIGLFIGGFKSNYQGNPLSGNIKISNVVWERNRISLKSGINFDLSPKIEISNIKIINAEPSQQIENLKKRINGKWKNFKIK